MGRRRLLIGLTVVVAALLVVGLDGWVFHHFGQNAATKQYPDDYLNAVACPSPTQCWAVGQTASAPGGNTLSEARDPLLKHELAGQWHTAAAAAPGAKGTLEDITCPGATDCWAVGGDRRSSSTGTAPRGSWFHRLPWPAASSTASAARRRARAGPPAALRFTPARPRT